MRRIIAEARRFRPILDRDLVLPSWSTHPAAIPAAPSPWDEEFDGPLRGDWVPFTGGVPTAYDANKTVPSALYVSHGALVRPAPAYPFQVTSHIRPMDWDMTGSPKGPNIGGCWIVISDGTTASGRYVGYGNDVGSPGSMWYSGSFFGATGGFDGNIPAGGKWSSPGLNALRPFYCRVTVTSPTSMTHEISWDGRMWVTVSSAQNPGLVSAGYIGVEAGGAAAAFDFLRVRKL